MSRPIRMTNEEFEAIDKMRNDGIKLKDIARDVFNCSASALSWRLKTFFIKKRNKEESEFKNKFGLCDSEMNDFRMHHEGDSTPDFMRCK